MLPSIASARSILTQLCRPTITTARSLVQPLSVRARTFASEVSLTPTVAESSNALSKDNDGPLRPHLGIQVDPNHGLYAFFRKKVGEDGEVSYETVEPTDHSTRDTGRSWTAAELRRKSFKDLHTLWYILLREQNLLATQRHELKRMGADARRTDITKKSFRVRKTMARIKYVVNERRLAYEGAVELQAKDREFKEWCAEQERKIAERRASRLLKEEADSVPEDTPQHQPKPADIAAAGLFETVAVQSSTSAQAELEKKSQ